MSKKAAAAASSLIRLIVPAGKASPSPPVGPALGAKGVKSMDFCKEFNARTSNLEPGTPVPSLITVNPDRTFSFTTKMPPTTWLLKKAAGIDKGAVKPGSEIVGNISVKHVYEIAKIKSQEESLKHLPMESICSTIVATAKSMGIAVKV